MSMKVINYEDLSKKGGDFGVFVGVSDHLDTKSRCSVLNSGVRNITGCYNMVFLI